MTTSLWNLQHSLISRYEKGGLRPYSSCATFFLVVSIFWPTWRWYFARMVDGSDEPWGIVALVTAVVILLRKRDTFSLRPNDALPFSVAYVALYTQLPALVMAAVALLGVTAYLGFLRERNFAVVALFILSLPIISTAQFFGGYPLRVIAGEICAQLLSLGGLSVTRSGALLQYHDKLIWIDAPCSGVRTFWCTSFLLATLATMKGLSLGNTILASVVVAPLALLSNVARLCFLFLSEAQIAEVPEWYHDFIGILILLGVLTVTNLVVNVIAQNFSLRIPTVIKTVSPSVSGRTISLYVAIFVSTLIMPQHAASAAVVEQPEWPTTLDGTILIPIPLTERDKQYLEDFPGTFARFKNGEREVLIRYVTKPTRKLHPVSDCLRGMGYSVRPIAARLNTDGQILSCVRAEGFGSPKRVCEYISDLHKNTFADPSSWFWSSTLGKSKGPWFDISFIEEEL